jgi:hypothetical protein
MKTTISRPVPPGAAAAQPAPEPTARPARVGSTPAWKRTLAVIVAAGTIVAATLSLGMALAAAAAATPPTATEDPHGQLAQGKAPDQSERDTTQARHRALGALSERDTTQARHRALGALSLQAPVAQPTAPSRSERDTTLARHHALGALAAPPAATTHPAAPVPGPGVDVVATLLVGLVGGLVGGALVVVVTRPGRLRMRGAA